MQLDDLLKLAWSIAELEARALGSRVVEPTHFLLAALKIVDLEFPAQLDALNIETEKWKSMCENARSLRNYLDIIPDKVTEVRRRVRHRLSRNAEPPVEPSVVIHRSRKTRAAFFDGGLALNRRLVGCYGAVETVIADENKKGWAGRACASDRALTGFS